MKRKVYIAGPMRGKEDWNRAAFKAAREFWEEAGWHVFDPCRLCDAHGYERNEETVDRAHLLHVIQSDMSCLYAVDAVAVLPGWEHSKGCTVEIAMAQFLHLPVYDAITGDHLFLSDRDYQLIT